MKEIISFIDFTNMSDEEKYKLLNSKDYEIERLNNLLKETSQTLSEQTTKAITLKSENERLNKELIDTKKFKNSILEKLEKRTLERDKLRERLKVEKRSQMKEELKQFDINIDDIKLNNNLFDNIHEALEKMKLYSLSDRFEVVLNNNLIEAKDKYTRFRTILGCRVSYDNLDKNVSFIVREDTKPSYETLEQEIERLNNIINELEIFIKEHCWKDDYNIDTIYVKRILDKLQELKGSDKE